MKQGIILIILVLSIASCNTNKDEDFEPTEHECGLYPVKITGCLGFIGYSLDEIDTIYTARYKPNSGLTELLGRDTFIFNSEIRNTVTIRHDTINLSSTVA